MRCYGGFHWQRALLVVCCTIWQVYPLLIHRGHDTLQTLVQNATHRDKLTSKESCTELINMETHFTVEVLVGTPPQRFELVADTGSDAVIVQSCVCKEITPDCKESEDCFIGTNKSKTFVHPGPNESLRVLSFGSGDIVAAIATDVVQLGGEKAMMNDGLLLMVNRALDMPGEFEGIIGLGVPSWIEEADTPPKLKGANPENLKNYKKDFLDPLKKKAKKNGTEIMEPLVRFLEEAGVDKFSICMNDQGQSGALRLEPSLSPTMLEQVGHHHWTLDFQGVSVGGTPPSSDHPIVICDKASKPDDQDMACAGIPDSGTTLLMGPAPQILTLFGEICHQWPRCKEASQGFQPETTFQALITGCKDWMGEEGFSEVPSIFLHLGAADGATEVLELTAWSYIAQTTDFDGNQVCQPLFGQWDMHSVLNGPVWILGTPLFHEYQVVYQSRPTASIGFSKSPCTKCGEETSFALDKGFGRSRRIPRQMHGKKPRMPHIDPRQPP